MTRALDGLRLAVGTLTAIPVRPPGTVDRVVARWAMLLAPLAVVPLGVLAGAVYWLGVRLDLPGLAVGFAVVGVLALGTRALHLDGLSDVADGLTASYDRERSLAVMKSGTSGPAGTVALIIVLGAQAAAIASPALALRPHACLTVGLLVCLSRCALVVTCARGVPSARADGLGTPFAGSVPVVAAGIVVLAVVAASAGLAQWTAPDVWVRGAVTGVVALLVVALLVLRSVRRFGGVTGDVYGAAIEVMLAVLLVGVTSGPTYVVL